MTIFKKSTMVLLLLTTSLSANHHITYNKYFDKPLFNYNINKNRLPQGNYTIIRSHKKITQLLISSQWQVRKLYIDRNNVSDSIIYLSAMALYKQEFIETKSIDQALFNLLIKNKIVSGDHNKLTTHKYNGLKKLIHMVKKGSAKIYTAGSIITIKTKSKNNKWVQVMTLDYIYKNLVINNYFDKNQVVIKQPSNALVDKYYIKPVVIYETKDSNIIKLINNYAHLFLELVKK